MKLLIAYVSRHGSTQEIAETLGAEIYAALINHGIAYSVDVLDVADVGDLDDYDAVIVGSAVYFGRWLAPMRRFVETHREELATRRLWVFDSGSHVDEDPGYPPEMFESLWIVSYRRFGGSLDRSRLSWWERAVVTLTGIHDADLRSLEAVCTWGHNIAASIGATRTVPAEPERS